MADPLDPDQALRKRLTAQLAPQAQTADAGASTAETPLSAPIESAPFPSAPNPGDTFNGATWVGGGASGVVPTYGTNPAPVDDYGQAAPLPSDQPIIPGGNPVPGAPHPGWPTMPPLSTPTPPLPEPPPPEQPIIPGGNPVPGAPHPPWPSMPPVSTPVGSPDAPRMTYGPTDWAPQPPSLSKPRPTLLPEPQQNNLVVAPQQQLRRRLLSTMRRPFPRRRV